MEEKICKNCGKKYKGCGKYFCSYKCSRGYPISEKTRQKSSDAKKGNKNPMWKGDNVGYASLHEWIEKYKPKPKFCEICKVKPPIDLANISGEYKRDINDFEWICRKCHMNKDGRLNKIIKLNHKRKISEEEKKQRKKEYREQNKEKLKQGRKKWVEKNKEELKLYQREYMRRYRKERKMLKK